MLEAMNSCFEFGPEAIQWVDLSQGTRKITGYGLGLGSEEAKR
jgi:hypothetical protein